MSGAIQDRVGKANPLPIYTAPLMRVEGLGQGGANQVRVGQIRSSGQGEANQDRVRQIRSGWGVGQIRSGWGPLLAGGGKWEGCREQAVVLGSG